MNPVSHAVEIFDVGDVRERYHVSGPHVTVVMPVPEPGAHGGGVRERWPALRNDLGHDGSTPAMLGHLDALVGDLQTAAPTALLSANDQSAVWRAVSDPVARSRWQVGPLPWLLPVLGELDLQMPVIGAVVDRRGADLLVLSPGGPEPAGLVTGEDDSVHKTSRGGWSQPNLQRHAEVVWERNAERVATAISSLSDRSTVRIALVTGDERAAALVAEKLERTHALECRVEHHGGRHEPDTAHRLHEAATDWLRRRHTTRLRGRLDRLEEALGRQDRAVDGVSMTQRAITERRVETLFLADDLAEYPLFDAAARDAFDQGAHVVLAPSISCRDGIGALLRYPLT